MHHRKRKNRRQTTATLQVHISEHNFILKMQTELPAKLPWKALIKRK